jgi:CsoR family transcriptional regulator, copper-sensing transcriptional repressor
MTEQPGYAPSKEQLLNRLRRVEGQVRGIARMVDEERYCIDVLNQISAIQRALDRVALGLVADHTRECVVGANGKQQEERTEELLEAIDRLVSRR